MTKPQQSRHVRALALLEQRAKRSDEEQLALLDHRFGKGAGGKRERARLARRIAKQG